MKPAPQDPALDTRSPFTGEGEVQALCRELDWAATPLGPVERWPPTLSASVRTIMESPFPINLWCGDSLVLIYNDAYRRLLGEKHPHALGRRGEEVWAEIWADIAPLFDAIRAGGPPMYADDAPFVIKRGAAREDAWFTFSLSPIRDDEGTIVAFLNIVSETTGRVLAERRLETAREAAERAETHLREVFAQAPAFLAVVRGPEHVFEFANPAYIQLVGGRNVVGQRVIDALPEVRGQGFIELLDGVLRTGKPYTGREMMVELVRNPGEQPQQVYVDFVYQPVREPGGTIVGVVAHGVEVTEQVLARQAIEQAHEAAERARAEAEQANRAKSQFLAAMSHELRTPLNAIAGYADLLLMGVRGEVPEEQRGDIARMRRSGQYLLGLINDILNFSKLEAGQVQYQIEPLELSRVVESVEDLIRPQVVDKGLTYERRDFDPSLHVLADADKLSQVLLNLLTNAVKFTGPGGTISLGATARGERVVISVRDTGRGIAPDELPHIFDPFVQVDRHLTPQSQQGVGLGLAISRDLAQGMGGTLGAESRLGKGSTFTVKLPQGRPAV